MAKKKDKKTAPADTPEVDVVVKKKGKPGRPSKADKAKPKKDTAGKAKGDEPKTKLVKAELREIQTAYNNTKQEFRAAWHAGVNAAQVIQKNIELMVDQLFKLEKAKTLRQAVEFIRSENEDLPGFSRATLYKSLPDNLKEQKGPQAPTGPRKPPVETPTTTPENGEKVAAQAEVISKELDKDRSPINVTEDVIKARVNQEVEVATKQLRTILVQKDSEVAKAKHVADEATRRADEATKRAEELARSIPQVGAGDLKAEKEIVKEEKEIIQVEVEMIADDGRGGKNNIYKQMLDFMMKKVPKFYLDVNAKTNRAIKAYT